MSKFGDEEDDYDLILLGQTQAAWRVSIGDDEDGTEADDLWLPKSQCAVYPTNPAVGTIARFTVPNWLAEEKGLV